MTVDPMKFARKILKKVSRSFALTIPMLDKKIKDEVLLTYLQDRILDNFEDEIKPPDYKLQKKMMNKISRIFSTEEYDRSRDFAEIRAKSYLIKTDSLKELNNNIDLVYKGYKSFDSEVQVFSHYWLEEMNKGMQKYLNKKVETFTELDEYCYYVAGTVGGFLTDLIIYKLAISQNKKEVLKNNFNEAGLFLQKVNLIRDIREDLASRDKHFWPLKELGISEKELSNSSYQKKSLNALSEMLADVQKHLPALRKYYFALPDQLKGYKKFFAVNNAVGLATLNKLKNNAAVFYGSKPVKISKLKFLNIIRAPEKYFLSHSK